jgi:hypothetical protein
MAVLIGLQSYLRRTRECTEYYTVENLNAQTDGKAGTRTYYVQR